MRRLLCLAALTFAACSSTTPSTTLPADAEPDAGVSNQDSGPHGGDAESPDAPVGPISCHTTADCPGSLHCLYWSPGCDQVGVCGELPGLDASFSCCGVCDCTGTWRGQTYTDFPFQKRDFDCEGTCTPPDGGVEAVPLCCPGHPGCPGYDAGARD